MQKKAHDCEFEFEKPKMTSLLMATQDSHLLSTSTTIPFFPLVTY